MMDGCGPPAAAHQARCCRAPAAILLPLLMGRVQMRAHEDDEDAPSARDAPWSCIGSVGGGKRIEDWFWFLRALLCVWLLLACVAGALW